MNGDTRSTTPALEARELSVPFGSDPGLAGISFRVGRGERFALVGSSGAGKTSLLRALSGSGPLTAGSVLVEGKDVTHAAPEKRGMVLLSQKPLLFPHLSVFENVAFPLRVRGVSRGETQERVREALASVRLESFGPRRPQSLSGGQAHRIALARAVVARPPVLLLDEPLTSLDPSLREEVRESILAVQEEYEPAVVLVTHDLHEAGRMAHFIGVILEGSLAQVAPPGELFRNPVSEAVARALGIPNSVPGLVTESGALVVGGWRLTSGSGGSSADQWQEQLTSGSSGFSADQPPERLTSDSGGLSADKWQGPGGRQVRVVFGPDAGRLAERGSGGIPVRVEELRHNPEGAAARVTVLHPSPGPAEGAEASGGGPGASGDPSPAHSPPSLLITLALRTSPEPGDIVELLLDPSRVHVFPS